MKKTRILVVLLAIGLAGCDSVRSCYFWCHDGTEVQRTYVDARDECQALAEDKAHLFLDQQSSGDPKAVNSALLALFAKCMHLNDWGVTAPKQEGATPSLIAGQQRPNAAQAGFGIGPGYGDAVSSQPQQEPYYTEQAYPAPAQTYPAPQPQGQVVQQTAPPPQPLPPPRQFEGPTPEEIRQQQEFMAREAYRAGYQDAYQSELSRQQAAQPPQSPPQQPVGPAPEEMREHYETLYEDAYQKAYRDAHADVRPQQQSQQPQPVVQSVPTQMVPYPVNPYCSYTVYQDPYNPGQVHYREDCPQPAANLHYMPPSGYHGLNPGRN